MREYDPCIENKVESKIATRLCRIEDDLVEIVKEFVTPLFTLFGYFVIPDQALKEIVSAAYVVDGRVV